MKRHLIVTCLCAAIILASGLLWAATPAATTPEAEGKAEESLTELNRQLTSPISSFWSIAFQQNNYLLGINGEKRHWNSNLNFQPLIPVALTNDWNLITRPCVTLFNSVPHPKSDQPQGIERTTGFGDTMLAEMVSPSPNLVGHWMFGLGPTFIFPTASSDYTGQGKWQAGPAAVVGYLSHKWVLGAFVQNWTSFGGSGNRPGTNHMNLQPIVAYFLPDGWSIGFSGNILADWKADKAGDTWTVPVGLGIGKVVKLGRMPVKLGLAAQYMVHHPDNFGQIWNIQLAVVPVLPKLIKGNLFGR